MPNQPRPRLLTRRAARPSTARQRPELAVRRNAPRKWLVSSPFSGLKRFLARGFEPLATAGRAFLSRRRSSANHIINALATFAPVYAIVLLALLALACTLTTFPPTATPAPTTPAAPGQHRLVVAWVETGNLLVWREGESLPRRIASGGAIRPLLSPDGARIAFTRGPGGTPAALWTADADGVAERELVGVEDLAAVTGEGAIRQINQVAWLDARAVLFNTRLASSEPGPGYTSEADDLWRADAVIGQVVRVLPDGQGGNFAISPDGAFIALVRSGQYGGAPGTIRLVDSLGQAVTDLLTFDAVSTASEYQFYPTPDWLPDSAALWVAIPDPDLVYGPAEDGSPCTASLWLLGMDGTATQAAEVPASFFGLPRWSPDGQWTAYLEQVGPLTDNTLALVLARGDGSEPARVVTGSAGTLAPPQWSVAGYTYVNGAPGETWRGVPGASPERFPAGSEPALNLTWADATTAVYVYAIGETFELRAATLADRTPTTIAAVAGGFPALDASREP